MTNLHRHDPLFLGFDTILSALNQNQKQMNFPPYNIVKIDDNSFVIELAIAGYKKEDITITLGNRTLEITGVKSENSAMNYVHKGISSKSFTRTFTVADTAKVQSAEYVDGILSVSVKNIVPSQNPVQTIKIS